VLCYLLYVLSRGQFQLFLMLFAICSIKEAVPAVCYYMRYQGGSAVMLFVLVPLQDVWISRPELGVNRPATGESCVHTD